MPGFYDDLLNFEQQPQAEPQTLSPALARILNRAPIETAEERAYNYMHGIDPTTGKKSRAKGILANLAEGLVAGTKKDYKTPYQRFLEEELAQYKTVSPYAGVEQRALDAQNRVAATLKMAQDRESGLKSRHAAEMTHKGAALQAQKLLNDVKGGLYDAQAAKIKFETLYPGMGTEAALSKMAPEDRESIMKIMGDIATEKALGPGAVKALFGNSGGRGSEGRTTVTQSQSLQQMMDPISGETYNTMVPKTTVSRSMPGGGGGSARNIGQRLSQQYLKERYPDGRLGALFSSLPDMPIPVPHNQSPGGVNPDFKPEYLPSGNDDLSKNLRDRITNRKAYFSPAVPNQPISPKNIISGAQGIPRYTGDDAVLKQMASGESPTMAVGPQGQPLVPKTSKIPETVKVRNAIMDEMNNVTNIAIQAYGNKQLEQFTGFFSGSPMAQSMISKGIMPEWLKKITNTYQPMQALATSMLISDVQKNRIREFSGAQTNARDWELVLRTLPEQTDNADTFLKKTILANLYMRIAARRSGLGLRMEPIRQDIIAKTAELIYDKIVSGKDFDAKYFDPDFLLGIPKQK